MLIIRGTSLVYIYLKILSDKLFSDMRMFMKNLTLQGIREILRLEVRKSILHRCVKRIIYQTFDKSAIDFRPLKLDWERKYDEHPLFHITLQADYKDYPNEI